MAERDERLYLSDIVTAIDRILEYTAAGRQRFFDDQLTQDAVVRNIEIIPTSPGARSSGLETA